MANIKDLKRRIKSTKSTFKITSAMKLVSAAKLARAQHAIVSSRPYAQELENLIKTISGLSQNYSHPFLKENSENKQTILLVISSNKGLCGGYNNTLSKAVKAFIKENTDRDVKVYFIGKKARILLSAFVNKGKTYTFKALEPTYSEVREVASELSHLFESGEIGKLYVAYNLFKSALNFIPTVKQVLPLSLDNNEKEKIINEFPFDFKYDPNPNEILDSLVPEAYYTSVYTSILDALASEHGSRMSAMDNATRNCKEMIRSLTLKMNKLRQAMITKELIEVVSGAESLNG